MTFLQYLRKTETPRNRLTNGGEHHLECRFQKDESIIKTHMKGGKKVERRENCHTKCYYDRVDDG